MTRGGLSRAAFALASLWQLTLVTDKFFWLHDDLFRKRVASGPYDVPTAIDVLGYGAFPRLPKYAGGTAADHGTANEWLLLGLSMSSTRACRLPRGTSLVHEAGDSRSASDPPPLHALLALP